MYLFTPPSHKYAPLGKGSRLWAFFGMYHGMTVIKRLDGSYTTAFEVPTTDQFPPHTRRTYVGGHVYTVDDAEAAALIAAGFGAFISSTGSDPTGYGLGLYGTGAYGA